MPKKPRTPDEVAAVKQAILDGALSIISKHGYNGFTMRKLGKRMGMAAKTIYNYFINQDEIYLHVLTRGFELLHADLLACYRPKDAPYEKLKAMVAAWVDFGLNQSNYYDIMLTLYVPKYNDFVDTPLEPLAYRELQAALENVKLFIVVFEEMAREYGNIKHEDARIHFMELLVGLHGIVSLYNNTILNYVHPRPIEIIEPLTAALTARFDPTVG
jgi:AcrR family transcriptional regulator